MYASSCRAVVLIGATAAFCTAFLPHIAKPSVASKRAEANHPGACPPQWLPVLLASDPPSFPPPSSPSPFSPPSPPSPRSPPSPPSSPPAFCVDYEATEYLPVAAHFLHTNGKYLVWNGEHLDWPVAASSPVAVQVNFQYALEDISRDMGLSLNGVAVQVVAFPSSDTPTGVVTDGQTIWGLPSEPQFGKGRSHAVRLNDARSRQQHHPTDVDRYFWARCRSDADMWAPATS